MLTSRKVLANWTPEQIAAASNKMRPDLIAVLNAMNDHGGDYPAAARALGIRLGTLKSRLHRARKVIANLETETDGDDYADRAEWKARV